MQMGPIASALVPFAVTGAGVTALAAATPKETRTKVVQLADITAGPAAVLTVIGGIAGLAADTSLTSARTAAEKWAASPSRLSVLSKPGFAATAALGVGAGLVTAHLALNHVLDIDTGSVLDLGD